MSRVAVVLFFLACLSVRVGAQGCSDAGVCTMGAMHTAPAAADTSASLPRSSVKLAYSFGVGEQGVHISQLTPELNLGLAPRLGLQLKMPYTAASGNLGSHAGAGDLSVGLTWMKKIDTAVAFRFTLGAKIATGDASAAANGHPLPMPYQVSLGTDDAIAGISFVYKSWSFAAAYQQVVVNRNHNAFLHASWPGDSAAAAYFESNGLLRGNDALLRAEKYFTLKKWRLAPGLLAIYRLEEDAAAGNVPIAGSKGLTLNITGMAEYQFSRPWSAELVFGTPAIVRETRPDGLTRALVLGIGTTYRFGQFKTNSK